MSVVFTKGSEQEFVADRDFSLNWDDRNIKSVKIRTGESVFYDGNVAKYTKNTGEHVVGACTGLKSAINVMKWLTLKNGHSHETVPVAPVPEVPIVPAPEDYDAFKGGSFTTYVGKEMQAGNLSAGKVVHEKDLIVGTVPNMKEPKSKQAKGANLEVVGDQVAVKEIPSKQTLVSSSTVTAKVSKHSTKVIQADEMGSNYTKPIAMASSKNPKVKNSIMINETTPRILPEDMTMEDVKKLKKTIQQDESQGAKVVGKVAPQATVQEIDGIILRKTVSPTEMTIKTKTSSGGTPVVSAMEAGVVVAKVGEKQGPKIASPILNPEAFKKAEAAKAVRKASSAPVQAQIKPKVDSTLAEIASAVAKPSEDIDYLSMLPDTWSEMHWVQKEKFIRTVTNTGFLRFILNVESIKAVLDACEKRLAELEQD